MLVYNRPEKYFPERDEILERQGAARPHWYVICIVLHPSSHFKIKVVDSWYVRNTHSVYLKNLVKIFLELKGESVQEDIQIEEKHLNIILNKKQKDKYSCGDFSIEAVKCILENRIWVKSGDNKVDQKLKNLDITSARWRFRNIIDASRSVYIRLKNRLKRKRNSQV